MIKIAKSPNKGTNSKVTHSKGPLAHSKGTFPHCLFFKKKFATRLDLN